MKAILYKKYSRFSSLVVLLTIASLLISACQVKSVAVAEGAPGEAAQAASLPATPTQDVPVPSPYPTRPLYGPGELVDYTAQTGDTLPALAVRFNTTVEEILEANSFIPATATTMPPGMPMKIPIYYKPLWGSPYQIIPDSHFINGPLQVGFDTIAFVNEHPGWLKNYVTYASEATRTGGEVINLVARNYSVSPRLLLALVEYQAGGLSQASPPVDPHEFPLGYRAYDHKGLYLQLNWAANYLNNGYYNWRQGKLTEIEHRDGRITHFDPWQNAATIALHQYFNLLMDNDGFAIATSAEGLARTYRELFGEPWQNDQTHIPGSLVQPEFILPFEVGDVWAFTGGPHTGWGLGEPLSALDFAPPAIAGGCLDSDLWATAVSKGVVVRSETGQVMLDLDLDGDERTGWTVFYLHIATRDRAPLGAVMERGDRVGHPSCEGGRSTGTHIHLARKYNGEWVPAEGILAFNLESWVAHNGREPYQGTLTRFSRIVKASVNANQASFIQSDRP